MMVSSSFLLLLFVCGGVLASVAPRFVPIKSLKDEDAHGLRGMTYNDTQLPVEDPTVFQGRTVGLLAAHCFESVELSYPLKYFQLRGAKVLVLAPWWTGGSIAACEYVRATEWVRVDMNLTAALDVSLDVLLVPGGVWSSTVIRNDQDALNLVQQQYARPRAIVAAVCSGATVLVNANLAKGRKMTGSPAIALDLINAGAEYQDEPFVINDDWVVTGRSPQNQDSQLFASAVGDMLKKAMK